MSKLPDVTISDLLEAGVHFGHKTSRWNPKMASYIYGMRDDVHIIDLKQSAYLFKLALKEIYETVKRNGKVLFVSTKIQASSIVEEQAQRCGQYYVNNRWLGGMLTNWGTISRSIKKMEESEKLLADEEYLESLTKKEILELTRKKDKLLNSLGGIRNLGNKVDLLVVIDTNKERIAIQEAKKLNIPIIAIVDTNSNPDDIDFPIPGNDDAIRSIRFYCTMFADAALAGIEDALSASGVDVGAIAEHVSKKHTTDIEKIKNTKKIFKSKITEEASDNEEAEEEFEKALKAEATTKAKSPEVALEETKIPNSEKTKEKKISVKKPKIEPEE